MAGVCCVFSWDTIFVAPLSAFARGCSRLDNAIQHINLYPLDSGLLGGYHFLVSVNGSYE